jgi:Flp pilus assembly protein TadG
MWDAPGAGGSGADRLTVSSRYRLVFVGSHMSPHPSPITHESGQALVEFVLVLPLLILLVLGMLDFGKAYNYWNDATHLTAEAARFAAVNRKPDPANAQSLQLQILNQADTTELRQGLTSPVVAPAQVCVDFPNGTQTFGDPVRVRMTFTYHFIPFIGGKVGALTKVITSSTVMRLEAVPTTYSAGCT